MNEEDEVLMVSFTDALTCVLAASVALFLIFVVLIKLVPSASDSSGAAAVSRMRAAVAEDLKQGDSSALLRIASTDCKAIEALRLEPAPSRDFIIRSQTPRGVTCARLFSLGGGLRDALHVVAVGTPEQPVTAFLEVGAAYWPQYGAPELDPAGFFPCKSGDVVILRVENRTGEYLSAPRGGGCT